MQKSPEGSGPGCFGRGLLLGGGSSSFPSCEVLLGTEPFQQGGSIFDLLDTHLFSRLPQGAAHSALACYQLLSSVC
jgi:hypothetical protein